ncbi:P-loop containing nucleoside triphosphate hydrolase protein, partial [Pavlovales sp. CCMP2436]
MLRVARLGPRLLGARRASTFAELGLSTDVAASAEMLGFAEPTAIQRMAIPLLAEGARAVALAAETGGGKTVAYLLPLIEQLKRHESAYGLGVREPGMPRALVLTPSPELSRQVAAQLKAFAHTGLGVASCGLSQDQRIKSQAMRLSGLIDVVVCTPALLLLHRDLGHVALGNVRVVVVDEAEVLMARGPADDLDEIFRSTGLKGRSTSDTRGDARRAGTQVVFASATLTAPLRTALAEQFPEVRTLETSGLHRMPPGMKVHWLKIESKDRYKVVAELITRTRARIGTDHRKSTPASAQTLVFCNTIDGARACEHVLNEAGVRAVSCHGQMPPRRRRAEIDAFLGAGELLPVLVATDAASRGLHFEHVSHVVMADFPKDMADFVHRAGRTARQGRPGDVSVLVAGREADLANTLRTRIKSGGVIDPISAAR